jgi:hypothetical protein
VRAGEPPELYVGWEPGQLADLWQVAPQAARVVGVLVTDIVSSPRRLARMARGLRGARRAAPPASHSRARFDFVRSQLGPGYGVTMRPRRVAVAAGLGLEIETTYTGKCLAALIERTQSRGAPRGPILFWNTFNAVDVETNAPAPLDPRALPRSLRRFLAQRPVD